MDTDFDKRLEELHARFRQQLPERLRNIQGSWDGYLKSNEVGLLEELRFHVHKLAGAASTYGHTEIGDSARDIETRLDVLIKQPVRAQIEHDLQPGIGRIRDLINAL